MAKVKKSVRSANEDAMKFKNYLDSLSIRDHGKIITELADKCYVSRMSVYHWKSGRLPIRPIYKHVYGHENEASNGENVDLLGKLLI